MYWNVSLTLDVNWGSSTQAHVYRNVLKYSLKLLNTDDHIKNYRLVPPAVCFRICTLSA